jgi:polyhydroxyalkanoate synthesis regulator phasin
MCMLCIEIAKGHITWKEAKRNIDEMVDTAKMGSPELQHQFEILRDLKQKEDEHSKNGGSSDDKIPREKWI